MKDSTILEEACEVPSKPFCFLISFLVARILAKGLLILEFSYLT